MTCQFCPRAIEVADPCWSIAKTVIWKITDIEQREVYPTRRDPSIQDINFLGMLSMHSYMEINDSRMEDIQIGFWNPLKNLLDDDLKERKRLRKSFKLIQPVF